MRLDVINAVSRRDRTFDRSGNESPNEFGIRSSNGCVRMLPEDQLKMGVIPLGTPVDILT